jgi:hypothetical protein
MRVKSVRIGDARLRRAIGLRPGVERAHPADLVSTDTFGRASHPLRPQVGRICQNARQHGRDIPRVVTRANVREAIRKAGPIVHFPQQVGNFNHWIHIADLCLQFLGCSGNLAGDWSDDQGPGFKPNTFELSGSCSVRQTLQVEVEHLPRFGEPSRSVTLDAQSEPILLLHRGEC